MVVVEEPQSATSPTSTIEEESAAELTSAMHCVLQQKAGGNGLGSTVVDLDHFDAPDSSIAPSKSFLF